MHPFHLCCTFYRHRPGNPPLDELFYLRPQLGLRQGGIINSASAQDCRLRKASAAAVHESPTRLAEIICHTGVGAHGFDLTKCREVVLTTKVLKMRVRHGDVGLVKGGTDLAAVDAMADMTIYQARFLEWLHPLVSSSNPKLELERREGKIANIPRLCGASPKQINSLQY
jgi:hypothetical protein